MPLNFALVGCGGMAGVHAQALLKIPEVKVTALCDIKPACIASFKEKYFPEAALYEDYDTMLAELKGKGGGLEAKGGGRDAKGGGLDSKGGGLDAVVLVTPHTLHYQQAKAALEAGVNVLVEKPMVTSSEHAYDLWKTVKQTGKLLAVAFQAPYTPEYQYIQSLRDSGNMGKVQIIQGWLAQGWLKGTAGTWRHQPELSGGGQMYDSGAHVLNGMMWLMNEPVVEVSCLIDNVGSPVDINGVAALKFQSGALGSVGIGGNSPGWNVRLSIQTDKLQVITGPHGGFLEVTGDPHFKYPHVPSSNTPGGFTPHANFVNTLLGKEKLIVPIRYGVLLSALMDALYESASTGKLVKVKPVPDSI